MRSQPSISARAAHAATPFRSGEWFITWMWAKSHCIRSLRYPFQNWFPHKSNLIPYWFVIESFLLWASTYTAHCSACCCELNSNAVRNARCSAVYLSNQLCFHHFDTVQWNWITYKSPEFCCCYVSDLCPRRVPFSCLALNCDQLRVIRNFLGSIFRLHGCALTHRQFSPSRRMSSQRTIGWLLSMQKNALGYWKSGKFRRYSSTALPCELTHNILRCAPTEMSRNRIKDGICVRLIRIQWKVRSHTWTLLVNKRFIRLDVENGITI